MLAKEANKGATMKRFLMKKYKGYYKILSKLLIGVLCIGSLAVAEEGAGGWSDFSSSQGSQAGSPHMREVSLLDGIGGLLGGGSSGGCANGQCGLRPPVVGGNPIAAAKPSIGGGTSPVSGGCPGGVCPYQPTTPGAINAGQPAGSCPSGNCGQAAPQEGSCASGNCPNQGGCSGGGGGCGAGQGGGPLGPQGQTHGQNMKDYIKNMGAQNFLAPILGSLGQLGQQLPKPELPTGSKDNEKEEDDDEEDKQDVASETNQESDSDEDQAKEDVVEEEDDEENIYSLFEEEEEEEELVEEFEEECQLGADCTANHSAQEPIIVRAQFNPEGFRAGGTGNETVRQWQKEQESDSKRVIEHLHQFKDSTTDVSLEELDEFDRGVSAIKAEQNHKYDLQELKPAYTKNGAAGSCGAWEKLPVVVCKPLFPFRPDIPMWRYYVPFAKVETGPVPFSSGYYSDQAMQMQMQKSDQAFYQTAKQSMEYNWQAMTTGKNDFGWTKKEANQETIDAVREFDLHETRWRSASPIGAGYRRSEYHYMSTTFHEEFRDDQEIAGSIANAQNQPVWCHDGAVEAWNKNKPELPKFFSEFIDQQDGPGLMIRTYAILSQELSELKEYIQKPSEPQNCIKENRASNGGQTPNDLHVPAQQEGPEGKKFCQKNKGDTVGPFTNIFKTHYASIASELAFLRGLLVARQKSSQKEGVHPVQIQDYETSVGDIDLPGLIKGPRDKKQVLTNKQGGHNDTLPKECTPWEGEKKITAQWGGADYGEGNHSKVDHHFNRQVLVHWRRIQCCPVGYIQWPPMVFEEQTF